MKKSFILYTDTLAVLDTLTDDQAGKLFRAIKSYHETGDANLEGIFNAVFSPFKVQFERDGAKYQKRCESNKNNGLKGGRPRADKTQKNPMGYLQTQSNPIKPDSDSDSDSDKERITPIVPFELEFSEAWKNYPKLRAGSKEKARSAYTKAIGRGASAGQINASIVEYARSDEVANGFAKGMAAWLNDDRFNSDYSQRSLQNAKPDPVAALAEAHKDIAERFRRASQANEHSVSLLSDAKHLR